PEAEGGDDRAGLEEAARAPPVQRRPDQRGAEPAEHEHGRLHGGDGTPPFTQIGHEREGEEAEGQHGPVLGGEGERRAGQAQRRRARGERAYGGSGVMGRRAKGQRVLGRIPRWNGAHTATARASPAAGVSGARTPSGPGSRMYM